jgi:hypothetical protein
MQRFRLSHLLIILLVSLAGCSSKSLPGKWTVIKSWPEVRTNGIAKLEFIETITIGDRKVGKLNLVLNDGTTGSREYEARVKGPPLILMSIWRGDKLVNFDGIYKIERGKLILKIKQNLNTNDLATYQMPKDFNQQSGWDILELERDP